MFQWDKSINALNIPADQVVHLFRSMREVQLALPGVSAQQASAFLCQYRADNGVATVVVFHLHKNSVLAFYFSTPRIVPAQKMDGMLDQGLNYVESMGFLMTDQDIHLLDGADQEMLWSSLPLKSGISAPKEVAEAAASQAVESHAVKLPPGPMLSRSAGVAVKLPDPLESASAEIAEQNVATAAEPVEPPIVKGAAAPAGDADAADNVEDLLAAVEAMRAKRPGLRARKSPPTAEELERRRQQLCRTVGRILASL